MEVIAPSVNFRMSECLYFTLVPLFLFYDKNGEENNVGEQQLRFSSAWQQLLSNMQIPLPNDDAYS